MIQSNQFCYRYSAGNHQHVSFKRKFDEHPDCFKLRGNKTIGDCILKNERNIWPSFLETTASLFYNHFFSPEYQFGWQKHLFNLHFISSLHNKFLLPGEHIHHKQLVKYFKNLQNDLVLIIRLNNIYDDIYIKEEENQKFEDMPFIVILVDRKHNETQGTSDPSNPIYKLSKLVFSEKERLSLLKEKEERKE